MEVADDAAAAIRDDSPRKAVVSAMAGAMADDLDAPKALAAFAAVTKAPCTCCPGAVDTAQLAAEVARAVTVEVSGLLRDTFSSWSPPEQFDLWCSSQNSVLDQIRADLRSLLELGPPQSHHMMKKMTPPAGRKSAWPQALAVSMQSDSDGSEDGKQVAELPPKPRQTIAASASHGNANAQNRRSFVGGLAPVLPASSHFHSRTDSGKLSQAQSPRATAVYRSRITMHELESHLQDRLLAINMGCGSLGSTDKAGAPFINDLRRHSQRSRFSYRRSGDAGIRNNSVASSLSIDSAGANAFACENSFSADGAGGAVVRVGTDGARSGAGHASVARRANHPLDGNDDFDAATTRSALADAVSGTAGGGVVSSHVSFLPLGAGGACVDDHLPAFQFPGQPSEVPGEEEDKDFGFDGPQPAPLQTEPQPPTNKPLMLGISRKNRDEDERKCSPSAGARDNAPIAGFSVSDNLYEGEMFEIEKEKSAGSLQFPPTHGHVNSFTSSTAGRSTVSYTSSTAGRNKNPSRAKSWDVRAMRKGREAELVNNFRESIGSLASAAEIDHASDSSAEAARDGSFWRRLMTRPLDGKDGSDSIFLKGGPCVLVLAVFLAFAFFVAQIARKGSGNRAEAILDALVAFGTMLCLLSTVRLKRSNVFITSNSLLRSYVRAWDLTERWEQLVRVDQVAMLSLWLCLVASRMWQVWMNDFADSLHIAGIVCFSLVSAVLTGLMYSILHALRALGLIIDAFCVSFVVDPDLEQAVRNWNILQAVLRRVSGAMERSFLFLLSTASAALVFPIILVGLQPAVAPGALLILGIAQVSFCAGATTYKCDRVPALINSLHFGCDIDYMRSYVVEYVERSKAGVYVFEVRITAQMVLKSLYVGGAVLFGVVTKLSQSDAEARS